MKLEGTFKAHFDHTGSRVTARQCFLRTSSYVSQLVEPRFKYRDVLSGGRSNPPPCPPLTRRSCAGATPSVRVGQVVQRPIGCLFVALLAHVRFGFRTYRSERRF